MRFYIERRAHYCGVDLHARWMYLCILSHEGEVAFHRNVVAAPEPFLTAVAPFRDGLVVGAERGGTFPVAYVYPKEMRSTRDLLRRRTYLVRQRANLLAHIQNTNSQYNLPEFGQKIARKMHREGIVEAFPDAAVRRSIAVDLDLIDHLDLVLDRLKKEIERTARHHDPQSLFLLRTVHGIGATLGLVILYEIQSIDRFERVQEFCSYDDGQARVATERSTSGATTPVVA